jgi:hypothetical protein
MPSTFMGETVTVLRPAAPDDIGFVEGSGEQVLIRTKDGTEKIVAKADIRDSDLPPIPVVVKKAPRRAAKPKAPRKIVASASKHNASTSRYHRH